MNGSENPDPIHLVFISIGSNINPAENIAQAVRLLRQFFGSLLLSTPYETRAVGSTGPNFINLAAGFSTHLDPSSLKEHKLASIETSLGRVRSAEKNAPRTMDLDILVFDGIATELDIWKRVHLAAPLAELLPDLRHPHTGETVWQAAQRLSKQDFAIPRPEMLMDRPDG